MWEKIYDALASLFAVGVKVEKHEQEIRDLRTENRELLDSIRFLAAEIHRVSARQELDQGKIELYIENQLLKFERRLPSGKEENERKN